MHETGKGRSLPVHRAGVRYTGRFTQPSWLEDLVEDFAGVSDTPPLVTSSHTNSGEYPAVTSLLEHQSPRFLHLNLHLIELF